MPDPVLTQVDQFLAEHGSAWSGEIGEACSVLRTLKGAYVAMRDAAGITEADWVKPMLASVAPNLPDVLADRDIASFDGRNSYTIGRVMHGNGGAEPFERQFGADSDRDMRAAAGAFELQQTA